MCSISKTESEFSQNEPNENISTKRGRTYVQWSIALLASTTLLTYGLQAGWTSPMAPLLQSAQSPTGAPLTDGELSWVGSSLALSATCGVALYAYIADAYGRKFGIIAIAVPQALSWIIKLFATNSTMLIIARIVGGIPAGGCFNLVPMYLKEISQDNIRGAIVSMALLMQNFGLLAVYAMGSYLSYHTILYIALVLPIITTISMIFAPESPAYLVKKQKYEEAAKTTALLRSLDINDKIVESEVTYMKNDELHHSSLPKITFINIFKNKAWRKGFIIVMIMITSQAFNGNFTIMTYAWTIMSSSGVSVSPELQSLIVPILMIFGSAVSMVCVEKMGRKKPLIITYLMTTVAQLTLASTQLVQSQGGTIPSWLPVICIAVIVWSYAAGITPMVYVIMSEMFSFQVRAKLIGCIVTNAWITSYIQLAVFKPISIAYGMHIMFFVFAGVNLFGAIASIALVPETKGKSVEEIETILRGK